MRTSSSNRIKFRVETFAIDFVYSNNVRIISIFLPCKYIIYALIIMETQAIYLYLILFGQHILNESQRPSVSIKLRKTNFDGFKGLTLHS